MADLIESDPTVILVEDAVSALGVSVRTLQRLAIKYVGLSPSAMIRRRRLQEAAQLIREQPDADLATAATELGYAHHGHLTREFRSVLGSTPSRYRGGVGRDHPDA
ncbi:MAG: helix-turn-helix domain-containing protein [Nocardioides sp.]|nr:helix-turn-helix domain-containing protein [Nocardioides sp.]